MYLLPPARDYEPGVLLRKKKHQHHVDTPQDLLLSSVSLCHLLGAVLSSFFFVNLNEVVSLSGGQ